jgi:hypothetical protein
MNGCVEFMFNNGFIGVYFPVLEYFLCFILFVNIFDDTLVLDGLDVSFI